jgi:hypothetical protein
VVQNGTSYILDLKNSQVALLEAPTSGGYLDPTIGLRYSGLHVRQGLEGHRRSCGESACERPRDLLSTGRTDYGCR